MSFGLYFVIDLHHMKSFAQQMAVFILFTTFFLYIFPSMQSWLLNLEQFEYCLKYYNQNR